MNAPNATALRRPKQSTAPKRRTARLMLTITEAGRPTDYAIRKLDTTTANVWTLTKRDATAYVVRVGDRGPICTCPGFGFAKSCKHCDALAATGLICKAVEPPPAPPVVRSNPGFPDFDDPC